MRWGHTESLERQDGEVRADNLADDVLGASGLPVCQIDLPHARLKCKSGLELSVKTNRVLEHQEYIAHSAWAMMACQYAKLTCAMHSMYGSQALCLWSAPHRVPAPRESQPHR